LSPARSACYLGIGKTKIWSLIITCRIPAKKLDTRTLVSTADLDAFADGLPSSDKQVSAG
jgi:hypothetical protein